MTELVPEEIETAESGSGTLTVGSDGLIAREVELRWLVSGMAGYNEAEDKGKELAPLYYAGHRRGPLQCTPLGNGWYRISVTYANEGVDSYESWGVANYDDVVLIPNGISVDTTGGTEHITQSLRTTSYETDPEANPPDSFGAINVSGGQVNGVTKTVPAFNFTETWLVPAWYLIGGRKPSEGVTTDNAVPTSPTTSYGQALRVLSGTTNKEKWRIFEPGEVLFLGARYDVERNSTMVPVTFSFSVQPTRKDFDVGTIKVLEKKGWEFMWIHYEDAVDATALFPVKKPKYVYIDQIYEESDFEGLGISVDWSQHWITSGDAFTHPMTEDLRDRS
jgi:hypothetical protein